MSGTRTESRTKQGGELTLKDRLSRLTYRQACKLLGADGEQLIRLGGKWDVDIDQDVYLGGDLFRYHLRERTTPLPSQQPLRQTYELGSVTERYIILAACYTVW